MVALADDRVVVEVGTVGYEGVLGLPLFLGSPTSPNAAFCQVQGPSAVLAAADLRDFLVHDGDLHRLLHRYTQTDDGADGPERGVQLHHSTVQRPPLDAHDRRPGASADFPLTQEFLGPDARRAPPAVSEAAGRLQADGLIRYTAGSHHRGRPVGGWRRPPAAATASCAPSSPPWSAATAAGPG
jgi:hypothetical protein